MNLLSHNVKLEVYEGPLDLLLHLIKKDELSIYEISIELLTQQYIDYLETFRELNVTLASDFIVMASHLMYLKSRALLPPTQTEEDENLVDPRWDLIRQLLEYKKFKEAAEALQKKHAEQASIFTRSISLNSEHTAGPHLQDSSLLDLISAFQGVIKRFQRENEQEEIIEDRFNVSDKIDHLLNRFKSSSESTFSELFTCATSKQEFIVTFLALLELVKLRKLDVRQNGLHGEITIILHPH